MTIVKFLTARLDEDERAIETIREGGYRHAEWATEPTRSGSWVRLVAMDRTLDEGSQDEPERSEIGLIAAGRREHEHVVRWSPARVLAEVARNRRVMARHHDDGYGACAGCGHEYADISLRFDIEECPELSDLAAVYADHPDYDPAWRLT